MSEVRDAILAHERQFGRNVPFRRMFNDALAGGGLFGRLKRILGMDTISYDDLLEKEGLPSALHATIVKGLPAMFSQIQHDILDKVVQWETKEGILTKTGTRNQVPYLPDTPAYTGNLGGRWWEGPHVAKTENWYYYNPESLNTIRTIELLVERLCMRLNVPYVPIGQDTPVVRQATTESTKNRQVMKIHKEKKICIFVTNDGTNTPVDIPPELLPVMDDDPGMWKYSAVPLDVDAAIGDTDTEVYLVKREKHDPWTPIMEYSVDEICTIKGKGNVICPNPKTKETRKVHQVVRLYDVIQKYDLSNIWTGEYVVDIDRLKILDDRILMEYAIDMEFIKEMDDGTFEMGEMSFHHDIDDDEWLVYLSSHTWTLQDELERVKYLLLEEYQTDPAGFLHDHLHDDMEEWAFAHALLQSKFSIDGRDDKIKLTRAYRDATLVEYNVKDDEMVPVRMYNQEFQKKGAFQYERGKEKKSIAGTAADLREYLQWVASTHKKVRFEIPEECQNICKNIFLKEDKGLGDTVERITKATGIKKVVDYVSKKTGKDCGCSARKEYLNERFKYE